MIFLIDIADGGGTVNFITGGGGWLQTFIFGFGAIRINSVDYMEVNFMGYLLDTTTRLRLKGINYLGNKMDLEYSNSNNGQYFKPGYNMAIIVTYYQSSNYQLQIITNNATVTNLTLLNRIFIPENSYPLKICRIQT